MSTDNFGSKRFLIVDPNRHMRSLVRTMLQRFGGKKIEEAADTKKAFEAIVLSPPDLIICDREVGPMDGLDFIRDLRSRTPVSAPPVPVILLLSRTDQASIIEAQASGADHMLAKPVSAQTLGQRIALCFAPPRRAGPSRFSAAGR